MTKCEVLEYLKSIPREELKVYLLILMEEGFLSYEDVTSVYVEYIEGLRKCADKNYLTLQGKVMNMWCDKKKNMMSNLKDIVRYLRKEGRINITEEQIDKK